MQTSSTSKVSQCRREGAAPIRLSVRRKYVVLLATRLSTALLVACEEGAREQGHVKVLCSQYLFSPVPVAFTTVMSITPTFDDSHCA